MLASNQRLRRCVAPGIKSKHSALDSSKRTRLAASTSAAGVTKQATKRNLTQQSFASLIGSAKVQFLYSAASGRVTKGGGISREAVLRNLNGIQKAAEPQSKKTCMSMLQWGIPETDDISEGKKSG